MSSFELDESVWIRYLSTHNAIVSTPTAASVQNTSIMGYFSVTLWRPEAV